MEILDSEFRDGDLLHEGLEAERYDKYPQALSIAQQLIANESRNVNAWLLMARSHAALGDIDSAMGAYGNVSRLDPSLTSTAYLEIGKLLQRAAQWERAEQAMRQVLKIDSDLTDAWVNLGICLNMQGKHPHAIEAFNTAIGLSPEHIEAWMHRANSFANTKQWSSSISSLKHVLKLNPKLPQAYLRLVHTLKQAQRFEDIPLIVRLAVGELPDEVSVLMGMGCIMSELGRFDVARELLRKAVKQAPDLPEASHNLGDVLAGSGRWDKAAVAYQRALELDRNFAPSWFGLACAFDHLHRLQEARICVQNLYELVGPDDPEYKERAQAIWAKSLAHLGNVNQNQSPPKAKPNTHPNTHPDTHLAPIEERPTMPAAELTSEALTNTSLSREEVWTASETVTTTMDFDLDVEEFVGTQEPEVDLPVGDSLNVKLDLDLSFEEPTDVKPDNQQTNTNDSFVEFLSQVRTVEPRAAVYVKSKFSHHSSDVDVTEQLWLRDVSINGGKVVGKVENSPEFLKSIAQGDEVVVDASNITDWMIKRDGEDLSDAAG